MSSLGFHSEHHKVPKLCMKDVDVKIDIKPPTTNTRSYMFVIIPLYWIFVYANTYMLSILLNQDPSFRILFMSGLLNSGSDSIFVWIYRWILWIIYLISVQPFIKKLTKRNDWICWYSIWITFFVLCTVSGINLSIFGDMSNPEWLIWSHYVCSFLALAGVAILAYAFKWRVYAILGILFTITYCLLFALKTFELVTLDNSIFAISETIYFIYFHILMIYFVLK